MVRTFCPSYHCYLPVFLPYPVKAHPTVDNDVVRTIVHLQSILCIRYASDYYISLHLYTFLHSWCCTYSILFPTFSNRTKPRLPLGSEPSRPPRANKSMIFCLSRGDRSPPTVSPLDENSSVTTRTYHISCAELPLFWWGLKLVRLIKLLSAITW
jgi:hypothetical protein